MMATFLQWCDGLVNEVFHWLPPWRSQMPGLFKFFMLFGFGWGVRALWAAVSGWDLLAHQGDLDRFLTTHKGRVLLAFGGAVAVTQAWFLLRPRPLGLYMFWGFHAWWFFEIALYGLVEIWRELPWEERLSTAALLLLAAAVWPAVFSLYGWYHRNWFRTEGRAEQGSAASAASAEKRESP
jgi:hypothetical protein